MTWLVSSGAGLNAGYVPKDPLAPVDQLTPQWDGNGLEPSNGPDWNDPDLDYLPTWWENWYGTHPGDPDSDDDQILDRDELTITKTDPRKKDTDGDGVDDRTQWLVSQGLVSGLNITTSEELPSGKVGVAHSVTIGATSESLPLAWTTLSGMPAGLQLTNGVIAGKPTTAGVYRPRLRVVDAQGRQLEKTFALLVGTSTTPVILTPALLPAVVQGESWSQTLTAGNVADGPLVWTRSSGTIPAGITLNSSGVLSGTPTAAPAKYAFTLKVTDSANKYGTLAFSLYVINPATRMKISTLVTSHGPKVGTPFSLNLSSTGGAGTGRDWTILGGALPPGLALVEPTTATTARSISGTVTTAGKYIAKLAVTSTTSAETATQDFIFTVSDPTASYSDTDNDGVPGLEERNMIWNYGVAMSDASPVSNTLGINDWFYHYQYVKRATDMDGDGDGLGPILETKLGTTDSLRDSDGDGISDALAAWHVYTKHFLAGTEAEDLDGDQLPLALERILGTSDIAELGVDTDGDGLTDAEEFANLAFSDPTKRDTDGDGLTDGQEKAAGTSARNVDTDGDFLTDAEEINGVFGSFDPLKKDSDGDTTPDFAEADLQDSDGGGIPDRLEIYWGLRTDFAQDERWDVDSDGIPNVDEYLNGWDIFNGFNDRFDQDGDGMSDVYELAYGLDPARKVDGAQDLDADWLTNLEESQYGTHPRKTLTPGFETKLVAGVLQPVVIQDRYEGWDLRTSQQLDEFGNPVYDENGYEIFYPADPSPRPPGNDFEALQGKEVEEVYARVIGTDTRGINSYAKMTWSHKSTADWDGDLKTNFEEQYPEDGTKPTDPRKNDLPPGGGGGGGGGGGSTENPTENPTEDQSAFTFPDQTADPTEEPTEDTLPPQDVTDPTEDPTEVTTPPNQSCDSRPKVAAGSMNVGVTYTEAQREAALAVALGNAANAVDSLTFGMLPVVIREKIGNDEGKLATLKANLKAKIASISATGAISTQMERTVPLSGTAIVNGGQWSAPEITVASPNAIDFDIDAMIDVYGVKLGLSLAVKETFDVKAASTVLVGDESTATSWKNRVFGALTGDISTNVSVTAGAGLSLTVGGLGSALTETHETPSGGIGVSAVRCSSN